MKRIKNYLTAFGLLFFCANSLTAQTDDLIVYNFKAGYVNATQEVTIVSLPDSKSTAGHGFYAGFGFERRFAERFAVTLDFSYASLNSTIESATANAQTNYTRGIVMMPLSLKIYPTYDLGIFVGAYVTSRLHDKITLSSETLDATTLVALEKDLKHEMREDVKSYDYGLRFGADYRIWHDLHIEVFYHLGSTIKGKKRTNTDYKANHIIGGLSYRF